MVVATEDGAAMAAVVIVDTAAVEDVMEAVGTAAGVGAIGAEATGVMEAVTVDTAAVAIEVAEGAKAATAVTAAALTSRAHRF
jgi:hypothetical protein